jgi:Sec-independent protein secretion pathway component TatC
MAMLPPEDANQSRAAARIKAWCLICFALGLMLTNYPLIQIFNQPLSLIGIPMMLLYLLGIWLLAIVVLYILTKALARSSDSN